MSVFLGYLRLTSRLSLFGSKVSHNQTHLLSYFASYSIAYTSYGEPARSPKHKMCMVWLDTYSCMRCLSCDGRYTFRNQPEICNWNVAQLANALLAAELMPLVGPATRKLNLPAAS